MNIRIEQIDNSNLWNSFIEAHSPISFFQSYQWGNVIEREGHVWRCGLYKNDELIGVFQMEKIVARRGVFLELRHGPVLIQWNKTTIDALFSYLKEFGKSEGIWAIRMSPLIADSNENRNLLASYGCRPSPIHAMNGEYCWVLDVSGDEEHIMNGMRKTTRYLVRQSEKMSDVHIVQSEDIESFLKLYKETSKRHGFVEHHQVKTEYDIFKAAGRATLYLGYHNKELLAGAIIVFFGNQGIYRHGASIPSKIPVAYGIQWKAIQETKRRGLGIYNFWGIAPEDKENHPWRGITLFKKGFGGEIHQYIHAQDMPLSPKYWITYGIEAFRRMKKGY